MSTLVQFFSKEIFATQTAFANFVSFFSKKNERENLYQSRISDNTLLYKCMHYAVQLRNMGKCGCVGSYILYLLLPILI